MLLIFNKPFGVLSQFSDAKGDSTPGSSASGRRTLAEFIPVPGVYPAGRLDRDSEGLLLLTDDGALQHQLSHPAQGSSKTYLLQVEGRVTETQLRTLRRGVKLNDGQAQALEVNVLAKKPGWLWSRDPPIRERRNIPTSWLEIVLDEGRNRQARRMTAAVGLPTLRLVRTRVGEHQLADLKPGEYRTITP
ncbi:MAG: pseudouridine synthase [Xanthomonadales bacterium]|nr:pseudouridine synthase [Xanthomonadales bacterium]